MLKYFSMFSGIGGFELGIQRAALSVWNGQTENTNSETLEQGVESATKSVQSYGDSTDPQLRRNTGQVSCVGYSEIDKYAIKVYERRFNGHKNYGDATAINPKELPDFELLVGGFPCQAFSVAGKRKGFDDTRGTLFFDIARILAEKRPRHLVLENVKGLLSHDSGKTFQTILGVLSGLGYRVEWQVLNSKNFGVPQNRERIFIVGHLGGDCRRKVFPITGSDTAFTQVHPTIDANYHKGYSNQRKLLDVSFKNRPPREYARTAPTVRNYGGGGGLMPTVMPDIRRLTPKECERLQGFPDDWTAGESDTQRYKMCGNAVTVSVVEAVMCKLFGCA